MFHFHQTGLLVGLGICLALTLTARHSPLLEPIPALCHRPAHSESHPPETAPPDT